MAGVQREHGRVLVIAQGKAAFQFRLNGFNMRLQPCLCLPFGVQQAQSEWAELCRMALAPQNHFAAQLFFPFFQRPPDMAV